MVRLRTAWKGVRRIMRLKDVVILIVTVIGVVMGLIIGFKGVIV